MKPKIIVWGADNYNTLGIIRSLSVGDFDITLLSNGARHGVASASRYCHRTIVTHSIDEGVKYLVDNFETESDPKKKPVLITGGDATSVGTAENFDLLESRFHVMCTDDPSVLIRVTDKNEMGRVAEAAGILVPKAQEYTPGDTCFKVPFPVILKPVHTEGRVEFKTKVINTPEELLKFSKMLNPDNRYLMQQFVKRSHDIVVYGCVLPNGDMRLAGHHTLERWSDDGGGSYGHLYPDIPGYLNPGGLKRFFDSIGYHGLFSAEYGYEDGKAYFYEVNLRNDGFCHLSYQNGANLPLLWVCSCLGLPFTGSDKMTDTCVAMNEIYDIANVLHGNISWKRYKHDLREAKAFHFYDKDDLQPYRNMHRRMWWEIPFRAMLKTFRPQIVWLLKKIGK